MPELARLGRQLFYDPSFGGSVDPKKATGFSCITCHADFNEDEYSDGLIRSGSSIVGVTQRQKSQWKEIQPNQLLRSAGGAGVCYQRFLQGIPAKKVNPIAIPEQKAEALMAYFDYVTSKAQVGEAEQAYYNPLSRTEAQAAADKILKLDGDADKGWKLYDAGLNENLRCVTNTYFADERGIWDGIFKFETIFLWQTWFRF